MSEHTGSPCRGCGQTIYWHKSKAGKNYPTNSADDRRDFHQCPALQTVPQVTPVGPTLAERVAALEGQMMERVTRLELEVLKLRKRLGVVDTQPGYSSQITPDNPITESDIPF